ncbi:MAG: hypothetical protein PHY59_02705 [Methanobacterium sp.]|nr:hypothetical protein [Methanobacterium sp.]
MTDLLDRNYSLDSSTWIIDTPDNKILDGQKFTSKPVNINSIILNLSNKGEKTFILHIFINGGIEKHFNTYIVSLPKTVPYEYVKITNLKPQPAFFVLKIWM